uniref:Uncharacterized protein n=1 Tax=Coccidioides posadasii RMSCC 3488 TaxID=454284 RepID=A0A0J6F204_COCPO|nr:hypothetical protein CPAG_00450 [Coccidioides posadasii RMSCC 3488]
MSELALHVTLSCQFKQMYDHTTNGSSYQRHHRYQSSLQILAAVRFVCNLSAADATKCERISSLKYSVPLHIWCRNLFPSSQACGTKFLNQKIHVDLVKNHAKRHASQDG